MASKRIKRRACVVYDRLVIWGMACSLVWGGAEVGRGQKEANWRVWRTSDGLYDSFCTALAVSPRTNVWIRHGELNRVSWIGGYNVTNLPSPGRGNFRIQEGRSGQLWSLYESGIAEFEGGHWVHYPIPSIRDEIRRNVLRQVRQIPLVPAERNHVFFLLADRLVEFKVPQRTSRVVLRVGQTHLGKFIDMRESWEGDLWITGRRGVLVGSGPIRQIGEQTRWAEHLLPPNLPIENLQRPLEDSFGGMTFVGDLIRPRDRAFVRLARGGWEMHSVVGEKVRFAWMEKPKVFWAQTINNLVRVTRAGQQVFPKKDTVPGRFFDVATEPHGVFWMATSEGVARYAPLVWQAPVGEASQDAVFHAILEESNGTLWFASANGLLRHRGDTWQSIAWPSTFEPLFRSGDSLFRLPDGRLAVSSASGSLLFDPANQSFIRLKAPHGGIIRKIAGQLRSGALCLWTSAGQEDSGALHFEEFDGHSFRPFLDIPVASGLGREVYFLKELKNQDVWIGASEGVALYRNQKLHVFGRSEGYVAGRALCLLDTGRGKIWCGTENGLLEFDGKGWSILRLGLDRVNALTRGDDGSIWAATGNGVHRFRDESWVANSVEEGLPSSVVYQVREDQHHRVWAATTLGLSRYHPEADRDPPRTRLAREGNPKPTAGEEGVSIRFSGIDKWRVTPSNRLLFSFKLDKGVWSPFVARSSVSFQDLPAGKHRVTIRAMDRNWNEETDPPSLEFITLFPWYRDPRLIAVSLGGLAVTLFFAALAVNRHLRLVRSYAEVERIVTDRTRELEAANRELLHSQKMKALGSLAAGVAHDFNNILSIIKGSAQIIETNLANPEKICTRVQRIKLVVDQGAGIVKAMLGLSRVTSENLAPCDVNLLVHQTQGMLGDQFPHGVRIEFEPAPTLPPARGAGDLIQQILVNLIVNAGDAMSGKGRIMVRTGVLDRLPHDLVLVPAVSAQYVYVSVQDTGCGIAPENLPRIFEPFFTTKAFSSRRGTGLGLSMVYELGKELSYGLMVESVFQQGSTFTVIMPVWKTPGTGTD